MALGGSSNTFSYHGYRERSRGKIQPGYSNEIGKRTPYLTKLRPSGPHHIEELDRAGGIPAVMGEVKNLLKLKNMT